MHSPKGSLTPRLLMETKQAKRIQGITLPSQGLAQGLAWPLLFGTNFWTGIRGFPGSPSLFM